MAVRITKPEINIREKLTELSASYTHDSAAVINVKAFGAVGNGSEDDTAAIQAALNAGKKIALNQGSTYLVSGSLTVPAGVYIDGNGATIKVNSPCHLLEFTDGGGIKDTKLVGSTGAGSYNGNESAVVCEGTRNTGAAPTYVEAPNVEGCEISGFGMHGVFFAYCKGGVVRANKIYDCGYTGIGGVSCEDVIVTENLIEDITPGSPGDAYGVFIDRENGVAELSDPRSYRCVISNNVINRVIATGGNGQAIDTHAGVDFNIVGNVIEGCQRGIFVTSSVITGQGQQLGPKRVIVSGNTIKGDAGYGIFVGGAQISGSVVEAAEDCIVIGNTLLGYGFANTATLGAVMLSGTKNCKIANNVIKNPRCNGILMNLTNEAFDISGNTIIDPWDDAYTSPNCILFLSGGNSGFINGNVFRFENVSLGTYVAVNAVRVESNLTNLDIDFGKNQFVGVAQGYLSVTLLSATGVRKHGCVQQSGDASVTIGTSAKTGLVEVEFDKRMPYEPKIALTPEWLEADLPDNQEPTPLSWRNVSTTGFTIYAQCASVADSDRTVNVHWHAF